MATDWQLISITGPSIIGWALAGLPWRMSCLRGCWWSHLIGLMINHFQHYKEFLIVNHQYPWLVMIIHAHGYYPPGKLTKKLKITCFYKQNQYNWWISNFQVRGHHSASTIENYIFHQSQGFGSHTASGKPWPYRYSPYDECFFNPPIP